MPDRDCTHIDCSADACGDGSSTNFLGYERSYEACRASTPGSVAYDYSRFRWPDRMGTVAFRCYVDARTPMVVSILATVSAMIAKEVVGILVVIFMPKDAYADVLDVAADSIVSALYLIYRVILDCFRPVGLRAAIVDPTGKHTKPLIPMQHFIPKLTMVWKILVVVEVFSSLTLVATAFYQIVLFRGYIKDKVQQPYEGICSCSRQFCAHCRPFGMFIPFSLIQCSGNVRRRQLLGEDWCTTDRF